MIVAVRKPDKRSRLVVGLVAVLTVLSGCSAAAGSGESETISSSDAAQSPVAPTAPVATPAVPGMRATAVRLRTRLCSRRPISDPDRQHRLRTVHRVGGEP